MSETTIVTAPLPNAAINFFVRLAAPLGEIVGHFLVSTFSLGAIKGTELVTDVMGYAGQLIPFTQISIAAWILLLEVGAFTCINLYGFWKALLAYARA